MTSLRFGLCACVVGLLAASGCPGGDDTGEDDAAMTTMPLTTDSGMDTAMDSTGPSGTDLSHAVDIQPIWDAHCVDACHEQGGQWGAFLDMSDDAYDDIVGVMSPQFTDMNHVEAGSPDDSYLWHKINGTQKDVGGSGARMPLGGQLGQKETDAIGAWITACNEPAPPGMDDASSAASSQPSP